MSLGGGRKSEMSRLKILHAADFHLDTPFEGLPEGKAARRRLEQRNLLLAFAELARREHADLILLPGDLLDGEKVSFETESMLLNTLGSIPCPVIISPGNHDFYSEKSVYAKRSFPENVFIFRKNSVQCLELERLGVRVFGAAFTDRSCRPLLEGFHAEKYPDTINLLCLHANVDAKDSPYDPVTTGQIAGSGIDYAAFGHVHKGSGLRKAGETWYSWPGCPEGRGFDETGERSVNVVEIDRETGDTELRPVSIAQRHYEILRVDISESEPLLAIHAQLPENTEKDIYRILLTGETDNAPGTTALQNSLEGLFFHLQIRDETKPRQDIWEKAGTDTLRGIFLSRCRERYDAAGTEEERSRIEQTVRYGLAALDNREEV